MEPLENYIINFSKLSFGVHEFSYTPGDSFFENFEKSLITKCRSTVQVILNKQKDTLFTLDFKINANIGLSCDRCLDDIDFPLQTNYSLLVKIKDENRSTDDPDIIYINTGEDEINLAQYLYEFYNLSVPMKKTCELIGKQCNEEITSILKDHQPDDDEIDPRWEELKKFYKNQN